MGHNVCVAFSPAWFTPLPLRVAAARGDNVVWTDERGPRSRRTLRNTQHPQHRRQTPPPPTINHHHHKHHRINHHQHQQEDWEKEDFKPVLPAAAAADDDKAKAPTGEPSFEDEDAEQEAPKEHSIKPQPKKKAEKKYSKGEVADEPLDDPIAEKLRRQRLEEEADFRSARDLFGGGKGLDDMLPKTLKDFEAYAEQLAGRYLLPHSGSKNYKGLLKAVLRAAMEPLAADDAKEVEQAVAGVRSEKVKAQQAAAAAKKSELFFGGVAFFLRVRAEGGQRGIDVGAEMEGRGALTLARGRWRPPPENVILNRAPLTTNTRKRKHANANTDKKSLNVGKSGLSAGLDDYVYDGLGQDDDYDFM